jgi:glycosyltransferase involved in cell wall biosynthesis
LSAAPDISILSFDVSHNCLGRAHLLAEMLGRRFSVEIIGPATQSDGVWLPLRSSTIPIRWIDQGKATGPATMKRLLDLVRGKAIYAIKPRFTSYGLGLIARRRQGRPLVLDVDDWEMGFYKGNLGPALRHELKNPGNFNNLATTWALERLISRADAITASSRYLNRRFGGMLIPHCRDTAILDPALFDREAIRRGCGWQGQTVALFLGTPTPHKGIDVLVEASQLVDVPGFRLVIAGASPSSRLWDQKLSELKNPVELLGQQDVGDARSLLAAADIAVVPQLEVPATSGQVPAKITDALAMGKAIIGSAVSDIPEMLDGCGLLWQPGDVDDLAGKLEILGNDPALREQMGAAARRRCVEAYSYDVYEWPLARLFTRVAGLTEGKSGP